MKPFLLNVHNISAALLTHFGIIISLNAATEERPNILFVITDDQSWEHVGAYGDTAVRTPAMDALAENGIRFGNAYCAAPSCSPSRAGILTGQDIFRLEEGGVLTGFIREKFAVFPHILEENGYRIGFTGKGYAPVTRGIEGSHEKPLGDRYNVAIKTPLPEGISSNDYAAGFEAFLEETNSENPFFFWVGISEPHLPHPTGYGKVSGIDLASIRLPAFLPDAPGIRQALADYLFEIEWADAMLERILKNLEERQLLRNTLIVFTSDNGMPFPRAKGTLYAHGDRMPLIIRWDAAIKKGRVVKDPVSLIDLAPTLLDILGLKIPEQMTGYSLAKTLYAKESGVIDPERKFVVSAFEKHTLARLDLSPFPRRAIHTKDWTYIVNYEPDRDPVGSREALLPGWDIYGDIDPSIIKQHILDNEKTSGEEKYFELGFGKVSGEELYRRSDDDMMTNLAKDPEYETIRKELRENLDAYLIEHNDPRIEGQSPWDDYNYDRPFPIRNPDFKKGK